jgi:hypothetical protein
MEDPEFKIFLLALCFLQMLGLGPRSSEIEYKSVMDRDVNLLFFQCLLNHKFELEIIV